MQKTLLPELDLQRPTSLKPPRLNQLDKETLLDYYDATWAHSDWLMESITGEETLYHQADPLRHPLIFYLGHTAAFYINKLNLAGETFDIDPHLQELFAVGVDPKSSDELERPNWPDEARARDFRKQAHGLVRQWIQDHDLPETITPQSPLWALMMGIEHDLIHFETSSVLIRQYPIDQLTRPEGWAYAALDEKPPGQSWIEIPARRVVLGKPLDLDTYGWDNEYGHLEAQVESFEVSNLLVTNRDYAQFVADGGYRRPELWTLAGREWLKESGAQQPKFWESAEQGYAYRAMFDILPMPWDWPVEVNCHEAMAYCNYKGPHYRLLSELEYRAMADAHRERDAMFSTRLNLNLAHGSPSVVGSRPEASTPDGVHDARGNVWCWLADDFYPLPGFTPHPWYDDFSQPFFTSDHAMMAGGAWATLGTAGSTWYRLWFRRNFYQHAGFRLVRDRSN